MFSYLMAMLFLGAMVALAWWLKKQRRDAMLDSTAHELPDRIISALSLGVHQKIVTVEVGPAEQRTRLVLGVTAQSIQTLCTLPTFVDTDAQAPAISAIQGKHCAPR